MWKSQDQGYSSESESAASSSAVPLPSASFAAAGPSPEQTSPPLRAASSLSRGPPQARCGPANPLQAASGRRPGRLASAQQQRPLPAVVPEPLSCMQKNLSSNITCIASSHFTHTIVVVVHPHRSLKLAHVAHGLRTYCIPSPHNYVCV